MEMRQTHKQLQGSVSYAVREGRRGYGAEEEGTGHRLGVSLLLGPCPCPTVRT